MILPEKLTGAALADGTARASSSKLAGAALVGAAVAAGSLYYASRIEPVNVEVKEVSLVLPRLSPEFDGYRIAQISDIHMDGWMTFDRLCKLTKLVSGQGADLIAATGDFVTAKAKYIERELTEALALLAALDGVVAVLRNHDYIADESLVRRIIKDAGLTELANGFLTLERGEGSLHVAGIDNFYQRKAPRFSSPTSRTSPRSRLRPGASICSFRATRTAASFSYLS